MNKRETEKEGETDRRTDRDKDHNELEAKQKSRFWNQSSLDHPASILSFSVQHWELVTRAETIRKGQPDSAGQSKTAQLWKNQSRSNSPGKASWEKAKWYLIDDANSRCSTSSICIKIYLESYDCNPSWAWNMDETGLTTLLKLCKIMALKGAKWRVLNVTPWWH